VLDRIGAIYAVEARATFAPITERVELRREATPLVDAFFKRAEATVAKLSAKSSLAGAFNYAFNRREALSRFLTNGRLEIDNNIAENAMRCIALGRKNHLFAGSDTGGDRAAAIYTIVQTTKLNGVNPEAYLKATIARIAAGHPINRIGELSHGMHRRKNIEMSQAAITIEPTGENDTGTCPCCGRSSRCVWGFAYEDETCLAAYFVHWTLGHVPEQGANFDMIIGPWGEDAIAPNRSAVGLAYQLTDAGPSLMVIDASARPVAESPLVGRALNRNEVVGTSTAKSAFAVADAILAHDQRIAELLGAWQIQA